MEEQYPPTSCGCASACGAIACPLMACRWKAGLNCTCSASPNWRHLPSRNRGGRESGTSPGFRCVADSRLLFCAVGACSGSEYSRSAHFKNENRARCQGGGTALVQPVGGSCCHACSGADQAAFSAAQQRAHHHSGAAADGGFAGVVAVMAAALELAFLIDVRAVAQVGIYQHGAERILGAVGQ